MGLIIRYSGRQRKPSVLQSCWPGRIAPLWQRDITMRYHYDRCEFSLQSARNIENARQQRIKAPGKIRENLIAKYL